MTACSSFVQCARMLEPQHLVGKIHNGLFFICLVRQCVCTLVLRYRQLMTACSLFVQCARTLVPQYSARNVRTIALGRENSSRLVLHLFSAPARQYLSTSVQTSHDGLFSICLVRQYVSTLVLGSDNSSRLVLHLLSALVPQYSIQTTHHGLFFIFLVRQYVSTLVLGTDNS